LYQKTWERCFVRQVRGAEVQQIHAASKGAGWCTLADERRGLTIACRNFWQNYPKELEVEPGWLVFHAWPRHADPAPPRKIDRTNLFRMWFCHEGQELNFTVPPEYCDEAMEKSFGKEMGYEDGLRGVREHPDWCNAVGVAKTHDLLWCFSAPAVADHSALAAVFQQGPHAMVPPEWICRSGVFGWMHPYDPQRFAALEEAVSRRFDFYRRMYMLLNDSGMWNYGDEHTYVNENPLYGRTHRLWKGTHHRGPSGPWLLYARSADPKYLRFARDNTQHVLDVDMCHHAVPWYPGRVIGGGYHCKGYAHWYNGQQQSELWGHNCLVDFATWYWLLTGNRCGLDFVREWTAAMTSQYWKIRSTGGRDFNETIAELCALYDEFQDADLLDMLVRQTETILPTAFVKQAWPDYGPIFDRYFLTTGSRRMAQAVAQLVDDGRANLYTCACAARATGDARYLDRAVNELVAFRDSLYGDPESFCDGYGNLNHMEFQYFTQRFPIFLDALVQTQRPLRWQPLARGRLFGAQSEGPKRLAAWVQGQGATIAIRLRGEASSAVKVLVTASDGRTLAEKTIAAGPPPTPFEQELRLEVGHPSLRITIESRADFNLEVPLTDGREVYEFPVFNPRYRARLIASPDAQRSLYVVVPPQPTKVRLLLSGQAPASSTLFDLEDRPVMPASLRRGPSNGLSIEPPSANSAIYRLSPAADTVKLEAGRLYFALCPERLFVP
jgi:hypothetical protein